MSTQQEIAIRRDILTQTLERWVVVEQQTIESATNLIAAAKSDLVKQVMRLILRDSEKHKELLTTLLQITNGLVTITPEEVGEIDRLLEDHKQIEAESIILANSALEQTNHFVVRQMLEYMLQDERKHLTMTENAEEYKRKIYS
ncbi:MAG: ferritin-like domain-containing protein [Magnetococcales bacterium]|nr:ferritin-like domain-containing protein [Magnetococcales bacterium]